MSALARFELPARLEAHEPPEARGLARDEVRMLVTERASGRVLDRRARDLPAVLAPGDLLVVNTSATIPAALPARRGDGTALDLHVSTQLPGTSHRLVELRRDGASFRATQTGERLSLPGGAHATLVAPSLPEARLWVAELCLGEPLDAYLARYGRPITYRHIHGHWPLDAYQTVYASEPGSAEMPSAGRPLSERVITALVARGIAVAPIVLHAGVSSLEEGEAPGAEWFRVPPATARIVNATRAGGGRVVAVGTTVVRALETAADEADGDGDVIDTEGWTKLVVTPERGVRVIDGLLTGWHEPESSHLKLLRAVGGEELITRSYAEALRRGHLWHEFGDVHPHPPVTAVVGILGGSGRMGRTLAGLLTGAGYEVRLANSRGPDSMADLVAELGPRARAVEAAAVADGADVVVLATRWEQLEAAVAAVASWDGVVVIDTTNPRFGPGPDDVYDTGALSSSEVVAGLVPGARVVKAFNHQPIPALAAELGPVPTDRNALFLSGDDPGARAVVARLMRAIGGAPVDLGDLRPGGLLQASGGGPLAGHGRLLTVAEAGAILARTPAAR